MNIHTVAENLRKTIAGKEAYLQVLSEKADIAVYPQNKVFAAVADFLEININELKVILFDVEKCAEKATEDSWALNPDRSGGAFTDEEIGRAGEWH